MKTKDWRFSWEKDLLEHASLAPIQSYNIFIFLFVLNLFVCFIGLLLETALQLLHADQMFVSALCKTQTPGDSS